MAIQVPVIIKYLHAKPRLLFLIDGFGALVTAVMVGVVLVSFEAYIGMPLPKLYFLAALAVLYSLYSLSCYLFLKNRWKAFLLGIIIANLAYCCITLALLFAHQQEVTVIGWGYFLSEILIVLTLVMVEMKVYSRLDK